MNEPIVARDIFIKITDPAGRHRPIINQHRVWDAEAFIASQIKQYDGSETKSQDRRLVTQSTRQEYVQSRSANKH